MSTNVTTRQTQAARDAFRTPTKAKPASGKPKDAPAVLLGEHGRYQIKSGWLAGTFVARAFPRPPTKSRGMIAEATGATMEAAVAALQVAIDARETRRTEERRGDPRTGTDVPSAEEYGEALRQITLSGPQGAMLTALSLAGEDGLTEARMAYVAGYRTEASAIRSFAAAAVLFAEYLSVVPVDSEAPGVPQVTALLGFRTEAAPEVAAVTWILHPELRQAVRQTL